MSGSAVGLAGQFRRIGSIGVPMAAAWGLCALFRQAKKTGSMLVMVAVMASKPGLVAPFGQFKGVVVKVCMGCLGPVFCGRRWLTCELIFQYEFMEETMLWEFLVGLWRHFDELTRTTVETREVERCLTKSCNKMVRLQWIEVNSDLKKYYYYPVRQCMSGNQVIQVAVSFLQTFQVDILPRYFHLRKPPQLFPRFRVILVQQNCHKSLGSEVSMYLFRDRHESSVATYLVNTAERQHGGYSYQCWWQLAERQGIPSSDIDQ